MMTSRDDLLTAPARPAKQGRRRQRFSPIKTVDKDQILLQVVHGDGIASSISCSSTQVSNTNFQASLVFHEAQYASTNLLWNPVSNVMIGCEGLWGARENHDGSVGNNLRFLLTVTYTSASHLVAGEDHD